MKAVVISAVCALYLYGSTPQNIVNEVANLRQKYEECRQEQNTNANEKIKGYQKRIATLENQIKTLEGELQRLKKENTERERELAQKKGVIQSLEKSLTTKDRQYRDAAALSERLAKETNTIKVSKIERENLKRALVKAKEEREQLEKSMGKTDKEVVALRDSLANAKEEIERLRLKPSASAPKTVASAPVASDQSATIKALKNELAKANATIIQLQKNPPRVVVEEKVVTKVVEPTEKIAALQRELSNAQATIAGLRKGVKPIVQEKIVEKVVYKERPSPQEKVIEKIVYKERPVVKEKIVEKIVYKDRPIIQEKIVEKVVYKDRSLPQEKKVAKSQEATERLNRALQQKLAQNQVDTPPKASPVKQTSNSAQKGKSSAYRMASNAPIYNAPGGAVVDTWEARRSFTAGNPSGGWVHITGYFVNRVWQPTAAGENLYVRESDVIRR